MFIAPGTKWCGHKRLAKDYVDLGGLSNLDRCCRRHDMCPLSISGFCTKYHLFNYRPFSVSHCHCDRRYEWSEQNISLSFHFSTTKATHLSQTSLNLKQEFRMRGTNNFCVHVGYLTTLSVARMCSIKWWDDKRNWNAFGKRRSWSNRRTISTIALKGPNKNTKKETWDSPCDGWDSNLEPPE
jgi:hypothetical protein